MTPVKDISITIGQIRVRLGDLRGFIESNVILANGMKIKATDFEILQAKKALEDRAKKLTDSERPK